MASIESGADVAEGAADVRVQLMKLISLIPKGCMGPDTNCEDYATPEQVDAI